MSSEKERSEVGSLTYLERVERELHQARAAAALSEDLQFFRQVMQRARQALRFCVRMPGPMAMAEEYGQALEKAEAKIVAMLESCDEGSAPGHGATCEVLSKAPQEYTAWERRVWRRGYLAGKEQGWQDCMASANRTTDVYQRQLDQMHEVLAPAYEHLQKHQGRFRLNPGEYMLPVIASEVMRMWAAEEANRPALIQGWESDGDLRVFSGAADEPGAPVHQFVRLADHKERLRLHEHLLHMMGAKDVNDAARILGQLHGTAYSASRSIRARPPCAGRYAARLVIHSGKGAAVEKGVPVLHAHFTSEIRPLAKVVGWDVQADGVIVSTVEIRPDNARHGVQLGSGDPLADAIAEELAAVGIIKPLHDFQAFVVSADTVPHTVPDTVAIKPRDMDWAGIVAMPADSTRPPDSRQIIDPDLTRGLVAETIRSIDRFRDPTGAWRADYDKTNTTPPEDAQ